MGPASAPWKGLLHTSFGLSGNVRLAIALRHELEEALSGLTVSRSPCRTSISLPYGTGGCSILALGRPRRGSETENSLASFYMRGSRQQASRGSAIRLTW